MKSNLRRKKTENKTDKNKTEGRENVGKIIKMQ